MEIYKYPRTHHLQGSRFQEGDEDLDDVPLRVLAGEHVVIEEKIDGANVGVSYDDSSSLLLQSRGHFMRGGRRELQFDLFKQWAAFQIDQLLWALENRYVMYGEWTYAKHTVFYDELPHYFLEFDVLDTERGEFLSTAARRELLGATTVQSVPVLYDGAYDDLEGPLSSLIGRSRFKSDDWKESLRVSAKEGGHDVERVIAQTDLSDQMEGLYIKVERDGVVTARYKYIRADFLQVIASSDDHWLDRPLVKNRLAKDTNLFADV